MATQVFSYSVTESQRYVNGSTSMSGGLYYSQWNVIYSDTNNKAITASDATFVVNYPSIYVRRVNSNISDYTWSAANFRAQLKNSSGTSLWSGYLRCPSDYNSYTWTSSIDMTGKTAVQVYRRNDAAANATLFTDDYFTSSNSTAKTVTLNWYVYLEAGVRGDSSSFSTIVKQQGLYSRIKSGGEVIQNTTGTYTHNWPVTITLNAPPTFTSTNVSFNESYHVAGHTTASVTISGLSAKYGGTISSVVLKIGNQTASRTTNGTLSIACNTAGTFTPTVTVTDSRGQVTTKSLSAITINTHTAPTFTATNISFNESYHVAGHTTATTTVSNATANQGASISSVKLTIGSQTYTRTSSFNNTYSIACSTAGTFTPTVTITDSWGATTTKSLSAITINTHTAPSLTASQVTFNAAPYANYCTASVTITNATATQGSSISSIKLTIGNQTATGTGNGTLSINCNAVGTFTPTVVITDSWQSSKSYSLNSITLKQYTNPTVVLGAERTTDAGVANDEGTSAVVSAKFTFTSDVASLTAPTVVVKNPSGTTMSGLSVTWYTSRALTTAVTWANVTSGSTVYALITDSDSDDDTPFDTQYSYNITVTPIDNKKSGTAISVTLGGAYYTVDFLAGGHGIAFGKPATKVDTFDCALDMDISGDISYAGQYSTNKQITFLDGTDEFGNGMIIGGNPLGGMVVIGSGESAINVANDLLNTYHPGSEVFALTADGTMWFYTNVNNGVSTAKISQIDGTGYIRPALGFGSPSLGYAEIWTDITRTVANTYNTSLTTNSSDSDWMQAYLKAICDLYPSRTNVVFKGSFNPNSAGWYEVFVYNTSAVQNGLPRYSAGTLRKYANVRASFYTSEYVWAYTSL